MPRSAACAPRTSVSALRLEEVRDWLGHADIGITQRYAHLAQGGLSSLVGGRVGGLERKSGATYQIRTDDLRFTKPLLYQLS